MVQFGRFRASVSRLRQPNAVGLRQPAQSRTPSGVAQSALKLGSARQPPICGLGVPLRFPFRAGELGGSFWLPYGMAASPFHAPDHDRDHWQICRERIGHGGKSFHGIPPDNRDQGEGDTPPGRCAAAVHRLRFRLFYTSPAKTWRKYMVLL